MEMVKNILERIKSFFNEKSGVDEIREIIDSANASKTISYECYKVWVLNENGIEIYELNNPLLYWKREYISKRYFGFFDSKENKVVLYSPFFRETPEKVKLKILDYFGHKCTLLDINSFYVF